MSYPKQSDVEIPLLQVLETNGGAAEPKKIYSRVANYFPELTAEDQTRRMDSKPSARKWWNLVQWARQTLVARGEIDGSTRGVWKITPGGRARLLEKQRATVPTTRQTRRVSLRDVIGDGGEVTLRDLANRTRDEVKARLLSELRSLSAHGFEHFCKELLQQLGYNDVIVTSRSADGGIDGHGDFKQGPVNLKSAFQAKKWTNKIVGRPDVQRLRGALQGDFAHGVFLTTSKFSAEAIKASYKKGAIPVMLLDGDAISELMIDRGLGVTKQPIVLFEVMSEYFDFEN